MLKVWIEFSLESGFLGEMDKRSDEHDRDLHVLSLKQEVDSLGSSGDLTPDVDPATGKPRDPNKIGTMSGKRSCAFPSVSSR